MGNCCQCSPFGVGRRGRRVGVGQDDGKVRLLLAGLDNAGKTTAAKTLVGESVDDVVPTVGFSAISLKYHGFSVIIYDLGGGPQIRDIWQHYFTDVHGVIFVIDSSDTSRMSEGKAVLSALLSHDKVAGKPVLVLANKQDREGALDELDIVERFDLDALVNRHKCPTMVETCCSAPAPPGGRAGRPDPAVHAGYTWLMGTIADNYPQLNRRVVADMARQKELDDRERRERRERIARLRAERGEVAEEAAVEENGGDPFRPIGQVVVSPAGAEGDRSPPAPEASLELRLGQSPSEEGSPSPTHGVILVAESPTRVDNVAGRETEEGPPALPPAGEGTATATPRDPFLVPATGGGGGDDGSGVSVTEFVKDQLKLEQKKAKRKGPFRRSNKTAPESPPEPSGPGPRENGLSGGGGVVGPRTVPASPPARKPAHLPPLRAPGRPLEGTWTAPVPDVSWAVVADSSPSDAKSEAGPGHDHADQSDAVSRG